MIKVLAGAFFILMSVVCRAQTPSFDCTKAKSPDELLICRTPALARMDLATSAAFGRARDVLGIDKARAIGRSLLNDRAQCGSDEACILKAQSAALERYRSAGVDVVSPGDAASSLATPAGTNAPPQPSGVSNTLFRYLTPEQRATAFDPQLIGSRQRKSVTLSYDCNNCGVWGSTKIVERHEEVAPGVFSKNVTAGSGDEKLDGYVVLNGLLVLRDNSIAMQELSVKADGSPIGESSLFGLRVVSGQGSGARKFTLVCRSPAEVPASTAAAGAVGVARVFSCEESRQFGEGDPSSKNTLTRQTKWTYFRDANFLSQSYWDLGQSTSSRRLERARW